MVNQSTLHGTLFTFVLMCILVGPQSRVLAQISQEADIPLPLPVTGYDFANSGNDVYGEYDLTLYEDAEIVYDPQRGPVLQLGGTGYALSEQADLNVAEGFSVCLWVKVSPD